MVKKEDMDKKPRIAYWLANEQDREFMEFFLAEKGYLSQRITEISSLTNDIDLCIVDGASFSTNRTSFKFWRENTPYFIPVLLLTTNEYTSFFVDDLSFLVDQVLFLPVEKIEIDAAIKALIRSHNYAVSLWEKDQKLLYYMQNVFALLYEHFRIASFRWDIVHGVLYRSPDLSNLLPEDIQDPSELKCFFHSEDWPLVEYTMKEFLYDKTKNFADIQVRVKNTEGYHPLNLRLFLQRDGEGNPIFLDGILIDIESLVSQNEELQVALANQQILIREIFHRTRNNMQTIISLLSLYKYRCKESEDVFSEIELKIRALSQLQDMLYRTKTLTSCDIGEYLRELVSLAAEIYSAHVQWVLDLESDINLINDKAAALSLVVTELIQNSFKHAFSHQPQPVISLSLKRKSESICFRYEDNGQWKETDNQSMHLGLALIEEIVSHTLNGSLEREPVDHCVVEICFPGE